MLSCWQAVYSKPSNYRNNKNVKFVPDYTCQLELQEEGGLVKKIYISRGASRDLDTRTGPSPIDVSLI